MATRFHHSVGGPLHRFGRPEQGGRSLTRVNGEEQDFGDALPYTWPSSLYSRSYGDFIPANVPPDVIKNARRGTVNCLKAG